MSVKGESYKSKSAMKKHEKTESAKDRAKEYGAKKAVSNHAVKKKTHSSTMGKSKVTGKVITVKTVKGFGPRMKKGM